jgi:shikimate dehydrogenase
MLKKLFKKTKPTMKTFGLIGASLCHSFSKVYFENKFKEEGLSTHSYLNFEISDINALINLIQQNPYLCGLNVTIPYKQQVIRFLDEIEKDAQFIGAVNTIKIERQGEKTKLIGYNTDAYGFETSLKPHLKKHHKKAIILGTGGGARAVKYILRKYGISVVEISRNPLKSIQVSYGMLNKNIIKERLIIINTTPLGMYPNTTEMPDIPYEYIGKDHILFDLIYNPTETEFLKTGYKQGATCINGQLMLEQQAEMSWKIWNQ